MSRVRTTIAFGGGALVTLILGLVPSEIHDWFRRQASDEDADPAANGPSTTTRRPRKRRSRARR